MKGLEARAPDRVSSKRWGVSNFSCRGHGAGVRRNEGGENCATNQVLNTISKSREIEADLIPWCRKRHRMPIMAYSPLGAGGTGALLANPALTKVAAARGVAPAAVALAWAMRDGQTMALVESGSAKHVRRGRCRGDVAS